MKSPYFNISVEYFRLRKWKKKKKIRCLNNHYIIDIQLIKLRLDEIK